MKLETEEFLLIALAVIVFIAILIVIKPTITGFLVYEFSNFTSNEDITLDPIQLIQHSYTTNWTTENISNYYLIFAEENGHDRLNKLIELDYKEVELEKYNILKIKFNNQLQDGDIINFYLKSYSESTLSICDFNEDSCNETYASISYPGTQGFYQAVLSLPESVEGLTIDGSKKIRINYINASHKEITQHSNTTYYYNSAEIETEEIQPENLFKWDLFDADYTLNNQTINFYYTTNQEYTEFTPPYNFSIINSSSLKFKLYLSSDNTTTPIIHNLSISYIEYIEPCIENWTCNDWTECTNNSQTRTCTDQNNCETEENKPNEIQNCTIEEQENPPSTGSGKASTTRFKYSSPAPVETQTKTQTVIQQIEPSKISGEVVNREIEKEIPIKLYGNIFLFVLLIITCYTYYHKRIKNKPKLEIVW